MSRGITNNNPGNIRAVAGVNWKGQTSQDNLGFAVFSNPIWGIRALALDLFNSNQLHGRDTVATLTAHYAPPTENNTAAYEEAISDFLGVPVDQPIALSDYDLASCYVRAVIIQESGRNENGKEWYSETVIAQGMAEAGKWVAA